MARWNIKLIAKPDLDDINWRGGGDIRIKAVLLEDPTVRRELRLRLDPSRPEQVAGAFIKDWVGRQLKQMTEQEKKETEYRQNVMALEATEVDTTFTVSVVTVQAITETEETQVTEDSIVPEQPAVI